MANDQVSVEISIEEKAALKALTQLTKSVESFEKSAVSSVKRSDAAFDSFRGNLAAIGTSKVFGLIAGGLKSLVVGSFEASQTAETLQVKLEVLTGSAEKARDVFQQITEFAAKTPFQLTDITDATSQLLAFGFSSDEALQKIKNIGEISAGSGKSLSELTVIFGQVAGQGKLTAERLNQLEEAAVPIGQALADTLGVAKSRVRELVTQGVVDFATFEKAFNSLSEEGGLFAGSLEKQSNTLSGAISNLEDTFFNLQIQIGDTFKDAVTSGVLEFTQVLESLSSVIKENEDAVKSAGNFLKDYVVVYTNLAVEAFKAEKPIDGVNKKIEENVDAAQKLLDRKKELEESKGSFFGLFDDATQQSIQKVNDLLALNDYQLKQLIKERNNIKGSDFSNQDNEALRAAQGEFEALQNQRVSTIQQVNQKVLDERLKLENAIATIEQDRKIKEAEANLASQELLSTDRERILTEIEAFEIKKSEIILAQQMEANQRILDLDTRKLANKKASLESELRIQEAANKRKAAIDQQELNDRNTFLSKAVSLSQSSSKELQAIGKAAAIAQIGLATPPAIASSFNYGAKLGGPPLGFVFAGIAAAAQAEQLKRVASFQTGGVVGGFTGATNGTDNTTANVRTGEMVLNSNQQRQLFDIATGKESTSQDSRMIEVTSIVQIDEREIARAVRNQKIEGFQ